MGIFDKKNQFTRSELRMLLRKSSGKIPGTNRYYTREQRVRLEKEFGKNYGPYISKYDATKRLRELRRAKSRAQSLRERTSIDRKIRYLQNFFGIDRF